jgi:predicted negative regulator of RcsB-dependent stress response
MATHLDLEEQEQIDRVKAFWARYGNLITWLLVLVLGAYAAWNGWNWWQREQAAKAGALYDEVDKAAQAADAATAAAIFKTMQERFGRTPFTQQAGLLVAKVQQDAKQADAAQSTLAWVAANAPEDEYRTIALLRLAGLQLEQKKFDDALKSLDGAKAKTFEALVADRRGDVLLAQGKSEEAKAAYTQAWKAMDAKVEYRRLIDAKLAALGAPAPAEPGRTASAAESGK